MEKKYKNYINEEVYGIDKINKQNPENLPEITGKGGSPVNDISVSNDGKYVASCDGRVHIWDFSSGRKIRSFYTPSRVISVSFSPDNKYIVTGSANGQVKVWNAFTGKIHRNFIF
jgi:WD40 repeat protein